MVNHENVELWYSEPKELQGRLTLVESAYTLDKEDFREFYFKFLNERRDLYFSQDIVPCDKCKNQIVSFNNLRIMHGKRLHPQCFEQEFQDWLKRGKENGYVNDDARKLFERIIEIEE